MFKGNITKSTDGFYTASIFSEGERVCKMTGFTTLSAAQEYLKINKEALKVNSPAREEWKRSYPELEGKVVKWQSPYFKNNKKFKVVIAGFDYDIGISMVNPKDSDDLFLCYHGPASPDRKKKGIEHIPISMYNEAFKTILKMVENEKVIDVDEIYEASGEHHWLAGGDMSCAFNL